MSNILSILLLFLYCLVIVFAAFGGWQLLKLLVKLNVYVQLLIDREPDDELR